MDRYTEKEIQKAVALFSDQPVASVASSRQIATIRLDLDKINSKSIDQLILTVEKNNKLLAQVIERLETRYPPDRFKNIEPEGCQ